MKTMIIGFSKPRKWGAFAAAIIFADKKLYKETSGVSHAYTRITSVRWDCSFIYHSAGHSINFMGDKRFSSINESVEEYELVMSDEAESRIGKMCMEREGLKYPIVQQIGKGIVVLAYLLFKKKIRNPFASTLTDCMEEQAKILSDELGITIPLDMNSITIEPYRRYIASLPNVKRIK